MDADSVMRLFDGRKEIVSLQEARDRGLKHYYTGVPCKNGHDSEKITAEQSCVACKPYAAARRRYQDDPEKYEAWKAAHEAGITWAGAKARKAGKLKYFTGVPCIKGHISERYSGSNNCLACLREGDKRTKEQHSQKAKRYWAANKDKLSARYKEAYEANKEYHRERGRKWRRENPDKLKAQQRLFVHRRRAASGSFSQGDLDRIRKSQNDRCGFCKTKLSGGGALDHIVATSKGGTNNPNNLQWLCKSCNSSKRDRDQIDWAQSKGLLL